MNAHSDTQAVFVLEEGQFGGAEARAEGFCTDQDDGGVYRPGDIEGSVDYSGRSRSE